ncbi:unnamed protein product [Allacma fusca]|uniref:Uncharacterized protein n=1 Tax=Allacma fusca TaxID=39272 RepID=A0A8J2LM33_9HEXA|nr:unnamed protein product [Allacma fusca]
MPFKTSPYSAPVPIQICPCNNCQERAPPSCGNFVQEAPPQPTFLHNPAAVPSVPLLQPSAESTSGQVHYNVVQAKPLMTFVFGNGAQYAPAVIPILPYAPQIPFQDASSYNFQQGNGIHWIPSYQQQQFCYQPFTGQYMFHQPQPQNVPYMHHEDKESPVYYYYDPQDSVETQQNEEENCNKLALESYQYFQVALLPT